MHHNVARPEELHNEGHHGRTPEQAALRTGMQILVHLVSHPENRDLVLDSDLTEHLFGDAVVFSSDKKLRRQAARIVVHLAECGGDTSPRHLALMAKGCVGVMGAFLGSDDYELQCLAAETVCHMAVSEDLKVPIVQEGVLPALIALGSALGTEVVEHVARTVAELADNDHNELALVEAGALPMLMGAISPRCKRKDARLEAVRALSNLSSNQEIKRKIVEAGALGYLISMSKSGVGLTKMYALATLTNVSALAIDPFDPDASPLLSYAGILDTDPGIDTLGAALLMESEGWVDLISVQPKLQNDDVAGRQFLYPVPLPEPGTGLMLFFGVVTLSALAGTRASSPARTRR